jgi:hypothetical protein
MLKVGVLFGSREEYGRHLYSGDLDTSWISSTLPPLEISQLGWLIHMHMRKGDAERAHGMD